MTSPATTTSDPSAPSGLHRFSLERFANPLPCVPGGICEGCRKPFQPVRRNQRHCRPSCRRLTLERKRAMAEAARPAWQLFE